MGAGRRTRVRHWEHGSGDRNPFWAAARVAPPTFLFAMDGIVSGYVSGVPGIHAMYGGTDFRWRLPIREGDRVVGRSVLLDLEEKASSFARRAVKQTYRTTFVDDAGAVVCEADSWCFRTERDTARERKKYGAVEPDPPAVVGRGARRLRRPALPPLARRGPLGAARPRRRLAPTAPHG